LKLKMKHITTKNFMEFANHVAHPSAPHEHVEAAMERLKPYLEPYMVSVKGVRPQFKPINDVRVIPLQPEWKVEFYEKTWRRYEENCAKIGKEITNSNFLLLVEFLKYRQASESLRADDLAFMAMDSWRRGSAPVIAFSFKTTGAKCVQHLVNDHGIPRDKISLIWGGDSSLSGNKDKEYTPAEITDCLTRAMKGDTTVTTKMLSDITKQLQAKEHGLEDVDASLRLGSQSLKERQREIDRFQSGKSEFCLFSLKAGGVGLSLHHTDELTKFKARRQDNGWVVVDDIPLVGIRPRELFGTPTYSAIELVQMLGRCPRLTSMSATPQHMIYYAGTIEEDVADSVSNKLKCLSKLVKQNDSWKDMIIENVVKGKGIAGIIADFEDSRLKQTVVGAAEDDDDNILMNAGEEDDE
jgi:hypothetical protein